MKKTVVVREETRKNKNKQNLVRAEQNLKVDADKLKVLRTVREKEAFFFYEAVGKPTGEVARNLADFLDKLKSVKSESLMFHLQRKDFKNWVGKTLGDLKLARMLGKISASNKDAVRTSICRTVENRIKELQESSAAEILVDENSAILHLCP